MAFARLARTAKALVPNRIRTSIKAACGAPSTELCLASLKRCGFYPKTAIDVGAYSGKWTRSVVRLFPGIRVLMIEPQESKRPELDALASSYAGLEIASELLGSKITDRVGFYECDTASSVLRDTNHNELPSRFLPMTTLDVLSTRMNFFAPDFMKLDVQGYEMEVLSGAKQALESAEVVQMEINLLPIYRDAPLAHDAVRFMADRGFLLYDIGTFFRRPYDNALWQMDAVFVRSSSHLIASIRWS